jgi:hypothetical protein
MADRRFSQRELNKQDAIIRHQMLADSPLVKDNYPFVKKIIIKYKRESGSFEGAKDNTWCIWEINTDNRFYFHIHCINKTCVQGGFNLTEAVRNTILSQSSLSKGSMTCHGSEDAERAGLFTCLSEIEYEIHVNYLD